MDQTVAAPIKQTRLPELDSIRGLASISVVFGHLLLLWGRANPAHFGSFLYSLTAYPLGTNAVVLFFVLSGFVLSIPAIESRPQTYPVFMVRRIFRIYFPFLVALVAAILGNAIFVGQPTQSSWLNESWRGYPVAHIILQHLGFIGDYDSAYFDPPVWTLIYEMRISIVFPFLCALVLRLKPLHSVVTAVLVSVLCQLTIAHVSVPIGLGLFTVHYAMLFVLGINLARQRERISAFLRALSMRSRTALMLTAFFFYLCAGVLCRTGMHHLAHASGLFLADWFTAFGAAGLIGYSLTFASFRRVLLWTPIHNLGKMSYGVYLIHFIILLYLAHIFHAGLPLWLIIVLCPIVTVVVAWFFYQWVEVPFINWGRKASSYV